jgi:multimeric flavodoxin WrbA
MNNPFPPSVQRGRDLMQATVDHLKTKKKVLFLTTSNRWPGEKNDLPKSTLLAQRMAQLVGPQVIQLDVPSLKIYPCEGNVSTRRGNTCGEKKALLKDDEKNPSGCHRCWASINNKDDELWKISKPLLESEAVLLFCSIRWGQTNAFYQKLIERLTWLENRHSTLGESNLLEKIDAGLICLGHSARTLAFLKFDRAKITRWTKDPAMEGKVEAAGGFGTSIKLIQDAIIAKTGEEPYKSEEGRKLLYHQTAQVMSGQVVRLPNGKYISVFESGLVDYAKQMQNQGISRPSDEDDDYFRNISDVILADKDVYKNILELTGSGRFANKDKGPNFLRMLLELRDELRVKIPDAVTSFEDVTKPKLKNWIQEWLRESRGATSAFAEMPTESDRVKGRKGKPVIFLLIKEGLIDYSQVESAFREIQWSKAAPLLVQNLMQQLANEKNDPNLTNQYQEQARRLVNASRAGQPLP